MYDCVTDTSTDANIDIDTGCHFEELDGDSTIYDPVDGASCVHDSWENTVDDYGR